MISYEVDPSLYASEPEAPQLDDGFSRPQHGEDEAPVALGGEDEPLEAVLSEKSDF
ncbi:hypothetical protein [Caenimonas aquaedulcis]|uniref:Uncharacterized protein n=1 Tax=Caenimonas aquaedulcis TaxID=2793270 RepID=A0A931H7N5_9BURK|nr:hypothetical protein [Caenimonas aquaedulcis]MBG9390116.1 hypothetical protein [Caenimonas aquaedulcis]